MLRLTLALSASVMVVSACASSEAKPETASTATATTEHEGEHHEGHHEMADGPAKAFHEVLKPLWHAPAGAERTENTCKAAGQMHDMAVGMTTTTPANAKEGFAAGATALEQATAKLQAVCASADRAGFDDAFHAVHEAFHGVAEKCGE